MFEKSLNIIKNGTGTAFPCAAVAIGNGHNVFVRRFFGYRQIKPLKHIITEDTLFDLASLSKVVSTSMVALKLIEAGKICPDDKIGKFLSYTGNYANCEIKHLMTHTSGLPSGLPLFCLTHKNGDVINSILESEPLYKVGNDVCYSCMGYIVLQRILETAGNESLDNLAHKYVFTPLSMNNTCYNPNCENVAATELYPHNQEWATGHVHDENAYFLGGVAGNAGVFSTLDDMISFVGMCSEKGIEKNGEIYLKMDIFESAIRNYTPGMREARGLGFQLKNGVAFPGGDLLSEGSFGHTGFTGTSFYIDKETGLWGILLTNAVHYGRQNREEYFKVRRIFYDMIVTEYKLKRKDGEL